MRYVTANRALPSAASQSTIARKPSGADIVLKRPEFTRTSVAALLTYAAASSRRSSSASPGWMTSTIGRSNSPREREVALVVRRERP